LSWTIRFAQGLVAVTTLAGVALFGLFRFLHDRFYGAFGIRPDEVGLDFLTVVGRGGLEVATLLLVVTALVSFGYALGTAFFVSFVNPSSDRRPLPRPRLDQRVRSVFFVVLCLLAPIAAFNAIDRATARLAEAHEQVKKGIRVEPSAFLAIRVEPVTVEWIGDASPPSPASSELMLLGTGGGTVFAYDLELQSLVRYPLNAVAVFQRCHQSYPGLCLAPETPDLDCRDLPTANVTVREPDPYGLDADGDGVGCEGATPPAGRSSVIGGMVFILLVAAWRFARLWGFEPRKEAARWVEPE
jgi:hypothetical protein